MVLTLTYGAEVVAEAALSSYHKAAAVELVLFLGQEATMRNRMTISLALREQQRRAA
jgi:hypothetical protein